MQIIKILDIRIIVTDCDMCVRTMSHIIIMSSNYNSYVATCSSKVPKGSTSVHFLLQNEQLLNQIHVVLPYKCSGNSSQLPLFS